MKKSKKEDAKAVKESIKTTIGTTILLTIIVTILLIIFTIVKKTLLAGETIDGAIIFLAILPFIIYLAVSGKISEFRGGGFEVRFNTASNAEVYKSEKVAVTNEEITQKGDLEKLKREILPEIARKPTSTLSVIPGTGYYAYDVSKVYLEYLTKFDFFKYVLFVDKNNVFKGYIYARDLLAQLEFRGKEIIDKINSGDIENIPGFRKDYVKDYYSNKEVLKIMEKEGITDIAVVDKDMKFKGFTNQDTITIRIVNNLMVGRG